jgi:hypothetical protein
VSQDDPQRSGAVSGADVASPGVGTGTDPKAQAAAASTAERPVAQPPVHGGAAASPLERPEVLAGAAFAGAFVAARILKRIFD